MSTPLDGEGLHRLRRVVATAGELLFGEACVQLGFASQEQVDNALRLQAADSLLHLGQILMRRGILTTDQFMKALALQDRALFACPGCGRTYLVQGPRRAQVIRCQDCSSEIVVPAEGSPPPGPKSPPPQKIGKFVIEREIARGGMGIVYKARDPELGRSVAIKVARGGPDEAEYGARLRREASAAAVLRHPNIVAILEVGESAGRSFVAMDFIDGPTLREAMARRRLEPRRAAELLEQVGQAIDFSHRQGIIHRDLKPANVMIDAGGRAIVTDFGLARVTGDTLGLTKAGAVMGTPLYMAPEQVQGRQDRMGPHTDVYALGVILYEALTDRTPFQAANEAELYQKIVAGDPPHPSKVRPGADADLSTLALKAMECEPRHRYTSAGEFAAELRRYLAGEPIKARPLPAWERLRRRVRKHRVVSGLAGALLVAAATGGWLAVRAIGSREDAALSEKRRIEMVRTLEEFTGKAIEGLDYVELGPPRPLDKERAVLAQTITSLEKMYAENPDAHEALVSIATIHSRLRQYEKAEHFFERGLRLLGGRTTGRHHYQRALLRLAQLSEMKIWSLWWISEEAAAAAKARMDRLAGQIKADLAEADRRGLEVALHHAAYTRAMRAFALPDFSTCRTVCDEIVRTDGIPVPVKADALHLKAISCVFSGQNEEAALAFKEAAQIKRSDFHILLGVAVTRMYAARDVLAEAIRAAEECVLVDSSHIGAWRFLGTLRLRVTTTSSGEESARAYETALQAFQRALKLDARDALSRSLHDATRLNLLVHLHGLGRRIPGDLDAAIAQGEQTLAQSPDHHAVRQALIRAWLILVEQGGPAATAAATNVVREHAVLVRWGMVPDEPARVPSLGLAHALGAAELLRTRDFAPSVAAFEKAFELQPELRGTYASPYAEARREAGR